MWLLNVKTEKLEEITNDIQIQYAILSHTWGDDEVTFQDMMHDLKNARSKKGYTKIKFTCQQAIEDGFDYCWVDTICINRTSSAELSEAINSMYRWYRLSMVCYAYLSDVPESCPNLDDVEFSKTDISNGIGWPARFASSRWHTRSWTLQELIAPEVVRFYGAGWNYLGSKGRFSIFYGQHPKLQRLRPLLSHVTNIDMIVLENSNEVASVSAARKMWWASKRSATRIEDQAYSLLGIFRIHMPLLYGEGQNSFLRLQEEIAKKSSDLSLLAWSPKVDPSDRLLAKTPVNFREAGNIVRITTLISRETVEVTPNGMRANVPILRRKLNETTAITWVVLNCRYADDLTGPIAIRITFRDPELNKLDTSLSHTEYYEASISLYNYRRLEVVDIDECKRTATMQCLILTHDLQQDTNRDTCINPLPTFWFKFPKVCFSIVNTDSRVDCNHETGVLCPQSRDAVETYVTMRTSSQTIIRCILRFTSGIDFWSRRRAVHSLDWGHRMTIETYEREKRIKHYSSLSIPPSDDQLSSGELGLSNGDVILIALERREVMGTLVFVINLSLGNDRVTSDNQSNGDSMNDGLATMTKVVQFTAISGVNP